MRAAVLVVGLFMVGSVADDAGAESLGPGMRLPDLVLADQHDAPGGIAEETRLILFTRDMDGAGIVKEALADDHVTLLAAADAICVADISGMPSLITRMFALPAMRKRPYRMLLDRDGKQTADWPSVKGKVTVLYTDALVVQRVEYVDSVDALRSTLQNSAAAPSVGQ